MFPCPKCRTRFPFYRIMFHTKNTEFVCSTCGAVSTVRRNFWLNFSLAIPSGFLGTWIAKSHFSVVSITVFFAYLTAIIFLTPKFEKLEILKDADHAHHF